MKLTTLLAAFVIASTFAFAADSGTPAGYPLKKCPVSDEALGGMGKPFKVTYEGSDVYLCCKSCLKDFNKEPAKFVKIVKDASAKK